MPESPIITQLRMGMRDYRAQTIAGDFPDAAVVFAVNTAEQPAVLLTQRAPHLSLHAGEIAFPGGKQDPEDDSLLATALREMEEEVGVGGEHLEVLGALHQRITRTRIRVTPYLALLPEDIPLRVHRGELDSAFYVPIDALSGGELFSLIDVLDNGVTKRVARFRYGDYDIWGVTAMILADALNALLDAGLPVNTEILEAP